MRNLKGIVILLAVFLMAGFCSADIIINEIMQNPSAVGDGDGEWFELYNDGDMDVDIEGWIFADADGDSSVIANGGPLVIAAGGYLVLGNNADFATNGGVNVDYEYAGWYLSNGADEVIIYDDIGVEMDFVYYDGGPEFPDPTGASMHLTDPALDNNVGANWAESMSAWPGGDGDFGTPGMANSFVAPPDIVINEIMQNPSIVSDANGEWFELYNNGDTDVDINGWSITDADSDSQVVDNGGPLMITAGGYLVLGVNADMMTNGGVEIDYQYDGGSWFLSNGADEVIIYDAMGTEVDMVYYDGGPEFPDPTGASMYLIDVNLDNNVGANWAESDQPWPGGDGDYGTPGAQNAMDRPTELLNLGFEDWTDDVLDEWVFEGDVATTVSQEDVNVAEGMYAATVNWTDMSTPKLTQLVYDPVGGDSFTFGIMVYDNDISSYAMVEITYMDAEGGVVVGGEFSSDMTWDNEDWQLLTVDVVVPEGADNVEFALCFYPDELWNGSAMLSVDGAFMGTAYTNEYIQLNADDLLGSNVIATGIVTQPNGVVADDRTDAYFQDETSYGIMMYDPDLLAGEGLDRGDEIMVVGTVADYFGVTEIVDFVWFELSSGNPMPDAMEFTTGDFIDAQAWEGVWAEITGILNNDPEEGSYNLYIDDGSGEATARINGDAGLDLTGYVMGDEITVRGVIDLYFGGTQVTPSLQEDIGALAGSPLILTATPWLEQPWVGPNGGMFRWDAYVENTSEETVTFDAWTALILPDGTEYGTLDLFEDLALVGGATLEASPAQSVPGFAPNGIYTYIARVGQYDGDEVEAEASFQFAKLPLEGPTVGTFNNGEGWVLTDWFEMDELDVPGMELNLPKEYALDKVYPNPFNPTTTITMSLPEIAKVKIVVVNTLGQQVAVLANGYQDAGYHNYTFNASGLASGIYFVQATVPGQLNEMRKIVLMK